MRAAIRLTVALYGLTAVGCSSSDPCADKSGLCLGLQVHGTPETLDQLQITVDALGETLSDPSAPASFHLPARVALLLPSSVGGQSINLAVAGLVGGQAVSQGTASVTLPSSGHVTISVTLSPGDGFDLGTPSDLTSSPTVDVAGATKIYELDTLSLTLTGNDPTGTPFTIGVPPQSMLPTGMTTNVSGTMATISWTPTLTQAGTYTVPVTINSTDPSRNTTQNIAITVLNTADSAPLDAITSATIAVPHLVGDFDKDGFGDLATCGWTYTAADMRRHYHVEIFYGDKSGFVATLPASRISHFIFDARNVNTSSSDGAVDITTLTYLPCIGLDFDHDGNVDIAVADSNSIERAGTTGKLYVLFGNGTRSLPSPIPTTQYVGLVDGNVAATEELGGNSDDNAPGDTKSDRGFVAGDFNGDGWTDLVAFAPQWGPYMNGAGTYYRGKMVYWFGNKGGARLVDSGAGIASTYEVDNPTFDTNTATDYNCEGRQLWDVGDFDGDGKSDLLIYEPNDNISSVGPCPSAGFGGARTLTNAMPPTAPTSNDFAYFGTEGFGSTSSVGSCDLDGDHKTDFATIFTPNGGVSSIYVYGMFPWNVGSPYVLPAAQGTSWGSIGCVSGFANPGSLLATRYAGAPGIVFDVLKGGTLSPTITYEIGNIDQGAGNGSIFPIEAFEDVDGDGQNDAVVYTRVSSPGGHGAFAQHNWILYGRPVQ